MQKLVAEDVLGGYAVQRTGEAKREGIVGFEDRGKRERELS